MLFAVIIMLVSVIMLPVGGCTDGARGSCFPLEGAMCLEFFLEEKEDTQPEHPP